MLAGVLAQVLAIMGVLARALAQVLAGRAFGKTETKQPASTCASTLAGTPILASTCASTPASTFLEFPFSGPVPGRRDLTSLIREEKVNKAQGTISHEDQIWTPNPPDLCLDLDPGP